MLLEITLSPRAQKPTPKSALDIKKAWLNIFGSRMKEYEGRNNASNFYLPVLHAKLFGEVCGGSSAEKHVPDFIFDLPRDMVSKDPAWPV